MLDGIGLVLGDGLNWPGSAASSSIDAARLRYRYRGGDIAREKQLLDTRLDPGESRSTRLFEFVMNNDFRRSGIGVPALVRITS